MYFKVSNSAQKKTLLGKMVVKQVLTPFVSSLITFSYIDFSNALLLSLQNHILKKLQSVIYRAARLIFGIPPRISTTSCCI